MNNEKISVTVLDGVSKTTNKPWQGVLVTVGEWSTLVFPKSKFEMNYIKKIIAKNAQTEFQDEQ